MQVSVGWSGNGLTVKVTREHRPAGGECSTPGDTWQRLETVLAVALGRGATGSQGCGSTSYNVHDRLPPPPTRVIQLQAPVESLLRLLKAFQKEGTVRARALRREQEERPRGWNRRSKRQMVRRSEGWWAQGSAGHALTRRP